MLEKFVSSFVSFLICEVIYATIIASFKIERDGMEQHKTEKLTGKQNIIQILKFTVFSVSAGIIQLVSFTLMNEISQLPYWPSYLIALTLSVLYNFTLNKRFTFKSAANVPVAMLKVAGFYLVFTPLSTWWGDALTGIGWNEYIVLFGTMLVNLASEYIFAGFLFIRVR
ncbi:MAG: GtrA-like protein [Firmicutes bacterium ADurb.Bin182]|nr:MAG: GtrA-like protein [Firmicutes bacterium ADurb.Bin182]